MSKLAEELRAELTQTIIPFWRSMRDDEYGGYYGLMDYDLRLDKRAVKGCILNSRILWFFSSAYMRLGDAELLDEARHAYEFFSDFCFDTKNGGVYWSLTYDGKPYDAMKHTYNQAFAIYALAAYYRASGDEGALGYALSIYKTIEERCKDERGYCEAFTAEFEKADNEKLSENGVMADRTMNTLLHVFEAYSELYKATGDKAVGNCLKEILDTFFDKVYNRERKRQEVFFDDEWKSLIDLHSYGHDIETAWLIDRGCDILGAAEYTKRAREITKELERCVYERAYRNNSLANECENGKDDTTRVWWVQAEGMVGFYNAYQKDKSRKEYIDAVNGIWSFIKEHIKDKRRGSEWYWSTDESGKPTEGRAIAEPWKCPYHNGRMCLELMDRAEE